MTDGRSCEGSARVVQTAKNHLLGLPPDQGVVIHDLEALHQGHGEEEQRYGHPAFAGLEVFLVDWKGLLAPCITRGTSTLTSHGYRAGRTLLLDDELTKKVSTE